MRIIKAGGGILVALLLNGCASPALFQSGSQDEVRSICNDIDDLATTITDSGALVSDRWVDDIDKLGVRAASITTDEGETLMEGLAWWSVGLDEQDIDLALDGLDKIERICS